MQDPREQLQAFMRRKGLSQLQLAELAGVSQATVSRALSSEAVHKGAARAKLFIFASISEWARFRPSDDPRDVVLAAFERVWDQTEAHAAAIAKVIDALADLRPPSPDEKEK